VNSKQIYVNLPVKNLEKSNEFFKKLGFSFNPQFSDQNATCLIIGDDIYAMLLAEPFFKTFTKKNLADATKSTEVIVALTASSRDEVDELVNKALAAGGKPANEKIKQDGMYGWSFQDPDGHIWEVMYMEQSPVSQGAR
jgi:hypothetical protein